jgi:hypothetical protein
VILGGRHSREHHGVPVRTPDGRPALPFFEINPAARAAAASASRSTPVRVAHLHQSGVISCDHAQASAMLRPMHPNSSTAGGSASQTDRGDR